MDERVCLITGGTRGIGRVTARAVAQNGLRVVIVARDEERARAVTESIRTQTGSPAVDYLLADLSSQEQVRRLADEFARRYGRLDVLVNNAGAIFTTRQITVDGIERTFALNHLAPFLLTNLLLDTLKASAPSRVVTVSSVAHRGAHMRFDDPQFERRPYRAFAAYSQSKLANLLFTYELARRLGGTGVTANALHPGVVASNFGRSNGGIWPALFTLSRPFMISAERGAQTSIYLATAPEIEGITGEYFAHCRPSRSSAASYDVESQRRLWEMSERLTGLAAGELVH